MVDALNGLNRREFAGLPDGWEASFANPDVRAAVTNFALWIVREFDPRYLGLYREVYALVKAEAPASQGEYRTLRNLRLAGLAPSSR